MHQLAKMHPLGTSPKIIIQPTLETASDCESEDSSPKRFDFSRLKENRIDFAKQLSSNPHQKKVDAQCFFNRAKHKTSNRLRVAKKKS